MWASLPHTPQNQKTNHPWLRDFQLTDQNDKAFFSRDLTGNVWIGSFFFTRCGTVCPLQNAWLAEHQAELFGRNAKLVSISTDSEYDKPEVLRPYARELNAQDDWVFLTGDKTYIQRIGSEFLGLPTHGEHHSTLLAVVDRWGNVRGRIDWRKDGAKEKLLNLIDELNKEDRPVVDFEVVTSETAPNG